MVLGLSEGEPRRPNRVGILAKKGEDVGQVCILNRMRSGKLIKVTSGLNWEKPEEAGSRGGGQESKDISRSQRKRSGHRGYCGRESSGDFSAFSSTSQDLHLSLSFHRNQAERGTSYSPFKKGPSTLGIDGSSRCNWHGGSPFL